MRELLQDNNISLDDMDPEDPQYSYLQWLVSEAEKKNKEEESNTGELFDSVSWFIIILCVPMMNNVKS